MKPSLAATLAHIRCTHRKRSLVDAPCGRCGGSALRDLTTLGEGLIQATARALMNLDGYTGKPTPLTYAAAVELLKEILPIIRAHPPVLTPGEEEKS